MRFCNLFVLFRVHRSSFVARRPQPRKRSLARSLTLLSPSLSVAFPCSAPCPRPNLRNYTCTVRVLRTARYVDLYWLVDDGGLAVLIPYLMVKTAYWRRRLGRLGRTVGGPMIRVYLFTDR